MNFKQAGFTLIELVMVIIVLGVLAAFAVPKFFDLSNEANSSANSYSNASTAANSAHSTACGSIPGVAPGKC